MNRLTFPQDFLWGAATSAHQVEGNNFNSDWWLWEHSEARAAALKKQNKNPKDYYSAIACDSYNRYEEDFDIAKKLNQNSHRLSLEWSRIQPRQGEFSSEAIGHYAKVLGALKRRGLKTFVTLHHFTNPIWFSEIGGWEKNENIHYFLEYAEAVTKKLGYLMDFICIINEPNFYAASSFLSGRLPPQKRNYFIYRKARNNLIKAHIEAYKKIKSIAPNIPLGSALAVSYIRLPKILGLNNLLDSFIYKKDLQRLNGFSDYFGINYYSVRSYVFSLWPPFIKRKFLSKEKSDLGWDIYPQGQTEALRFAAEFKKPIYITENGIADAADRLRKNFIIGHLESLHSAIKEGINIKGYFYWSLLDNLELDLGFEPRFGLVEIDRSNNLNRKIRQSAFYFAEIAKNNYIESAAVESPESSRILPIIASNNNQKP